MKSEEFQEKAEKLKPGNLVYVRYKSIGGSGISNYILKFDRLYLVEHLPRGDNLVGFYAKSSEQIVGLDYAQRMGVNIPLYEIQENNKVFIDAREKSKCHEVLEISIGKKDICKSLKKNGLESFIKFVKKIPDKLSIASVI